jgi:hypothetical protein
MQNVSNQVSRLVIESDDDKRVVRPLTRTVIEHELREKGFLDPTLGICEHFYTRDPVLAILETPELVVAINKPENPEEPEEKVILIDALLKGERNQIFVLLDPSYAVSEWGKSCT